MPEPAPAVIDVPDHVPAAPTCSEDMDDATEALQTWLDGAPASHVVLRLAPTHCYRIEGTVEVVGKDRFTLDGRGATLRAYTVGPADRHGRRTRAHLAVSGSAEVTVRNVVVDGGDTTPGRVDEGEPRFEETEAQHGFRVDGTTDPTDPRRGPNHRVTLDGVVADRVRGDGLYVRSSTDVVVRGATLGSAAGGLGRHGAAVVSGENVAIEASTIVNAAKAVLDVEPNLPHDAIRGVRFADNDVVRSPGGPPGLTFVATGGADAPIEEVAVVGNRLHGKELWIVVSPPDPRGYPYGGVTADAIPPDPGDPASYRRRGYRIEGNVSDTPTFRSGRAPSGRGAAIFIGGVEGVAIIGNTVPLGSDRHPAVAMTMVHLRDVRGALVADNDAPAVDGDGAGDGVVEHEGPAPCGSGNRAGRPLARDGWSQPC